MYLFEQEEYGRSGIWPWRDGTVLGDTKQNGKNKMIHGTGPSNFNSVAKHGDSDSYF